MIGLVVLHASNENFGATSSDLTAFGVEVNDRSFATQSKTSLRWIPGRPMTTGLEVQEGRLLQALHGWRQGVQLGKPRENLWWQHVIAGAQAMLTWTTPCSTRATRRGPQHWDGLCTNDKSEETHEVDGGWYWGNLPTLKKLQRWHASNSFQIIGVMEGVYPPKGALCNRRCCWAMARRRQMPWFPRPCSCGALEVGDESNGKWK